MEGYVFRKGGYYGPKGMVIRAWPLGPIEFWTYLDIPATGRWHGANWQCGFVDVCDTPYDELVQAAREVGDILYEYRLKN